MKGLGIVLACILAAGCTGMPAPSSSAGAPASSRARQIAGPGAVVTVLEDFDKGPAEIQLGRRIDAWGDRVTGTRSSVDIVDAEGGGRAARFSYTASFDSPFSLPAWKDTGLAFVGSAELPAPAAGETGIAFGLKPEGFSVLSLVLAQDTSSGTRTAEMRLFVNDGSWKDWRLPFAAFRADDPAAPGIDLAKPVRLEVYVPWEENWQSWHFRTGSGAAAAFSLDTLGYWHPAAKDDRGVIDGFDDERDRLPFALDIYGTSLWTDYAASDDGVVRANDGVTGELVTLSRQPGGPEDEALVLNGRLDLSSKIAAFHEAGQALTLYLRAPVTVPLAGAKAVSFLVRSDLVPRGTLEIQDQGADRYYQADFSVIGSWARVRIPFDKLVTDTGTLATAEKISDRVTLQLVMELPPADVERAAASGVLQFVLGLDSFALER